MTYVVYNPVAGHASQAATLETLQERFDSSSHEFCEIQTITDWRSFLTSMTETDEVVLCGGDGTLNRFINDTVDMVISVPVLYYPCGSGNDFLRDLGITDKEFPVDIRPYIKDLPSVTVLGKTYRFLNGVGYGIDGYCCEVGDRLRATSSKPVDYTGIAIKGVLFHYRPTAARVTVDGKTYDYKRVWIAPTMHGRFYGGGMMPAPEQKRNQKDGRLSLLVMHNASALKILCIFPSLFKGRHLKYRRSAALHEGHEIHVAFDRPVTLQIDGETIMNVSEYRAVSSVRSKTAVSV